ncbi:uncharacterized protein DS421_12g388150 [Arachis hypogaea]|nr:uncharacterized protein DS421_12g388150 [Arachis hypogaea]
MKDCCSPPPLQRGEPEEERESDTRGRERDERGERWIERKAAPLSSLELLTAAVTVHGERAFEGRERVRRGEERETRLNTNKEGRKNLPEKETSLSCLWSLETALISSETTIGPTVACSTLPLFWVSLCSPKPLLPWWLLLELVDAVVATAGTTVLPLVRNCYRTKTVASSTLLLSQSKFCALLFHSTLTFLTF